MNTNTLGELFSFFSIECKTLSSFAIPYTQPSTDSHVPPAESSGFQHEHHGKEIVTPFELVIYDQS